MVSGVPHGTPATVGLRIFCLLERLWSYAPRSVRDIRGLCVPCGTAGVREAASSSRRDVLTVARVPLEDWFNARIQEMMLTVSS